MSGTLHHPHVICYPISLVVATCTPSIWRVLAFLRTFLSLIHRNGIKNGSTRENLLLRYRTHFRYETIPNRSRGNTTTPFLYYLRACVCVCYGNYDSLVTIFHPFHNRVQFRKKITKVRTVSDMSV
jgi:hypothetical protein